MRGCGAKERRKKKSTNYEVPRYMIFSIPLSLLLSPDILIAINLRLPLGSETMFHTHTKQDIVPILILIFLERIREGRSF